MSSQLKIKCRINLDVLHFTPLAYTQSGLIKSGFFPDSSMRFDQFISEIMFSKSEIIFRIADGHDMINSFSIGCILMNYFELHFS